MKRRLPIILVLAAAAAWYFFIYKPAHPDFTYAATIEVDQVDVQPGVASPIAEIKVEEGQVVKEGQRLADLSCPDVRVAAGQAQTDYNRNAQLYTAGSLAASNFDHSKFANRDADVKLGWCTVDAPINGTVMTIYHRAGEWARPGQPILSLADLNSVYAFVYVGQPLLAKLKLGQVIKCTLPELPGKSFDGTLAYIRPEAEFTPKNVQTREERERLVYGIKVHFDNPDGVLKPGMTVEADLPR
jgi:HlyD family secretion protein